MKPGASSPQIREASFDRPLRGALGGTAHTSRRQWRSKRKVNNRNFSLDFLPKHYWITLNNHRNLSKVRNRLKIWHRKDHRISSHLSLCMLAYYVQWHITERLKPLLEEGGNGARRQGSLGSIFETLKVLTNNKIKQGGAEYERVAKPTESQQKIIELLGRDK